MARPVSDPAGGIRGLTAILNGEHGGAIIYDLNTRGYHRCDLGRGLNWAEFKNFIEWLPPTEASAYFRARHPNSWWWTPETDFLAAILCAIQGGNWQRSGGKGRQPEPVKRPSDKPILVHSAAELAARRAAMDAELARRAEAKRLRQQQKGA